VEALGRVALIALDKPAFERLYPTAVDKVINPSVHQSTNLSISCCLALSLTEVNLFATASIPVVCAQVSVLLEMWGFGDPKKLEDIIAEKRSGR
jgi:hypothetical protein